MGGDACKSSCRKCGAPPGNTRGRGRMYICCEGGRKNRVGLAEAGEVVFAVLAPGAVAGSGARPVLPPLVRRYRGRVSGPQRVDVIIVHGRRPRGVVRREAKDVDRGSRRCAPPRPGAAPPAGSCGATSRRLARALHNTSSARRRRHSPPRARDVCPHALRAQGPYSLSHAIAIYTQTISWRSSVPALGALLSGREG